MHRSGTSSLTGCLQHRGLWLGAVNTSAPHNANGNRENREVMKLNDEVLKASEGSWNTPPASIRWTSELASKRDHLLQSLQPEESGPWGFKDPRTLFTLPFWQEGLSAIRLVGTFRHPLSVAQSLQKRNRIPIEEGLTLWSQYNTRLLQLLQAECFPIVSFDAPTQEYRRSVDRIASACGLSPCEQADDFFDDTLRHHHGHTETQEIPPRVTAIHAELLCLCAEWQASAEVS